MSDETYLDRLIDEEQLRAYLADALGPADRLEVERVDAGHSNETLFVTWGEQELVVRRPPPGKTADKAHDVLREHHVVDALQETAVPVPRTVLASDDHEVMGSDFYVMEKLEGDVIRTEEPAWLARPDARRQLSTELVDTLAAIHDVDYEAVGLGEFGYPEGFTQRQVDRWHEQFKWARETTADHRDLPSLERITEWLQANVPEDHPETLVQGDYKLDNVMVAPAAEGTVASDDAATGSEPKIIAVFDWEMATLGDPFTDLGWMLSFWHDADDPEPPIPDLYPTLTARDGYLSRQELIDRYETETGYTFDEPRFYIVLATYKMGALGEMFFRRYLEGNSDDPMYPTMEAGVPGLLEQATAVIDGEYGI